MRARVCARVRVSDGRRQFITNRTSHTQDNKNDGRMPVTHWHRQERENFGRRGRAWEELEEGREEEARREGGIWKVGSCYITCYITGWVLYHTFGYITCYITPCYITRLYSTL